MESSAANIATLNRPTDRRAYLAGVGATTALIGAAIVAFLSVAAFVAFNGLPFGAEDSSEATVGLTAGAPEAAATAAAPAAGAVAAAPATPGPAATAEILAALPPGTLPPGTPPGGPGPGDPGNPTLPMGGPGVTLPGGGTAAPGALGNAVGGLENTASGLGLGLPLTDLTGDVTKNLDDAVKGTLNNVGSGLGNPHLGDQTTGAINNVTNALLGDGGLTDQLLGN